MKRLYDFLFNRWTMEVVARGTEEWAQRGVLGRPFDGSEYSRDFVDYKLTNKFDGSTKIKRVYLN